MSAKTSIEWTRGEDGSPGSTWNPLLGCTKVSPGCDNCYAIVNATIRAGNPNEKVAGAYRGLARHGDWTGRVNLLPDRLDQPIRWRKRRKIFVNSQSDLFHASVPDTFIAQVFAVMAVARHHTFQVLTKRHGRMRSLLSSLEFEAMVGHAVETMVTAGTVKQTDAFQGVFFRHSFPLPNVWLGVSVEDQARADLRIPALLDTPAAVRWLSCEPLLGPVELWDSETCDHHRYTCIEVGCWRALDWVVVGGESGTGARPMHPDWARSLRDQCLVAETPFLFKQWGEHLPLRVFDAPGMAFGRAYEYGGRNAVGIREPGPSGTYRAATFREMRVGESNRGGTLLDRDTFAKRVGKKEAGRELDGRTWDEYPAVSVA